MTLDPSQKRRYVFLDEAGTTDFSGSSESSRHFIIASVTMDDCAVGDALLALRRDLLWTDLVLPNGFHATDDRQAVRDRVFDLIAAFPFRVDGTIAHKEHVDAHLRADPVRLYKVVVYKHLKRLSKDLRETPEVQVTCAALGTRREQRAHAEGLEDILRSVRRRRDWREAMWSSAADPCLQLADYCCWAIQRRWERDDDRSYALIQDKIATEVELFAGGDGTLAAGERA